MADPCPYDGCQWPGICDGRHCIEANGAVRPTLDELDAERQRADRLERATKAIHDAILSHDLNAAELCMIGVDADSRAARALAEAVLASLAD